MIRYIQAGTEQHLQGILTLQQANLKKHLSPEVKSREGFLTVEHDPEILRMMNTKLPHIIALDEGRVVGYALSMVKDMGAYLPVLHSMFEKLESTSYKGALLSTTSYYIMGQVCIAEGYRGRGIFQSLYHTHRDTYAHQYDYFITEVSKSNPRSIRAHQKIGFKTVLEYSDATDEWLLILWDWML